MKSDGLTGCSKCTSNRTCKWTDAISTVTDFKCIDSRSQYLFRTCSNATSLVTSTILLLLCRAAVLWWIRSDFGSTLRLRTNYYHYYLIRNYPETTGCYSNEWGRLPEWSSSWSKQPDDTKLWPRRLSQQIYWFNGPTFCTNTHSML